MQPQVQPHLSTVCMINTDRYVIMSCVFTCCKLSHLWLPPYSFPSPLYLFYAFYSYMHLSLFITTSCIFSCLTHALFVAHALAHRTYKLMHIQQTTNSHINRYMTYTHVHIHRCTQTYKLQHNAHTAAYLMLYPP